MTQLVPLLKETTAARGLHRHTLLRMLIAAALLTALSATTVDAADETQLQFSRQIETPVIEQDELLSVTLDAGVYSATRNDLHDLRVVDADGRPLPHVVRQVLTTDEQSVRRHWTPQSVAARPLDDGGLEILIELDEDDLAVEGVRLDSPLRDFERQVRVETSTDGSDWQLVAEALIFDYSRFIDVRRDAVALPATSHRHLRIVIENVSTTQESELFELTRTLRGSDEVERRQRIMLRRQPFRINRVQMWSDVTRPGPLTPSRTNYPPLRVDVRQDDETSQTLVIVETRREPLTQFTLETTDRNFSRTVRVEVPSRDARQPEWRTIAESQVTRIDFKDLQIERLSIPIPETREQRYRLVIENGHNPPLELAGVSVSGDTYEVVYLAGPQQQTQLHHGNPGASQAGLDTTALDELLRRGYQPLAASLGPQDELTSAPLAAQETWPQWLFSPVVLIGTIGALVMVLGLVLYQAASRIDIDTATENSASQPPAEEASVEG